MIQRSRQAGFTLIELMITLVVIAILAAIALPSYESWVRKQKIRLAQSDLVALSLAMENAFQQRLSYASDTDDLPSWTPSSKSSDFSFSIASSDATSYTVEASGSGKLAGCSLSLDSTNTRSADGCGTSSEWY